MRWTIGRKIGASFSTLIVSIVLLAVVSVSSVSRLNENTGWVNHTYTVIESISDILNYVLEAENNSQAYLISGASHFIPAYDDSVKNLNRELENLTRLTRDNPDRRQEFGELRPLLASYERFSTERIRLRSISNTQLTDWNMFEGEKKEILDNLRGALDRMRSDERDLLTLRSTRTSDGVTTATILMWGTCGLGLVISVFSLIALNRGIVNPVKQLTGSAKNLGTGDYKTRVNLGPDDEVGDLALVFNEMADKLQKQDSEVRKSQKLFQRLFESVPDSIIVVDKEGKIVLANPPVNRTFGRGAGSVIGLKVEELMPERFRDRHIGHRAKFMSHATRREMGTGLELFGLREDGTEFPIEIALSPLNFDAELMVLAIIRDVTERVNYQEALERSNTDLENRVAERTEELEDANRGLEARNRELQDFSYVASHDLQEPLRKIQAFGDRLVVHAGPSLDEKSRDYLARMNSAAGRMQVLIDDLLTYSRVTTKANPFLQVDLGQVLREVLADLEILIERKKATVDISEMPTIEADPTQMRQILQNLIGNALKFQKPDQAPVVKISALVQKGRCLLSVSDNGIGFDEKYLEKIFVPFQRLHGRTEYEGSGIGLAVVRKIVDRHGGDVTASSTPGGGATFLVTLPIKQKKQRH